MYQVLDSCQETWKSSQECGQSLHYQVRSRNQAEQQFNGVSHEVGKEANNETSNYHQVHKDVVLNVEDGYQDQGNNCSCESSQSCNEEV